MRADASTIQEFIVEPPGEEEIVEPMSWFETPGALEIEIGCGKGGFLLSRAKAAPEVRLLGIEWAAKFFRYCADRMARHGQTNVRVMRTDAGEFVMRHLPPECVSVLHLYHPDPWPKKRHHKRRLVQGPFVETAVRSLIHGGTWQVQSDHAEYFDQIRSLLGDHPELIEIPWAQAQNRPDDNWSGTNYEIKYAREGRRIHRAAYRRK